VGLFLGLDSSTQSLSAILIDTATGQVVADRSLVFGHTLPAYGSPNGFLPNDDPAIKHSDPLMWVEALDRLLGELRQDGVDLGAVKGISGAGQQHGSVYLRQKLGKLGGWSSDTPLVDQVRPLLSRKTAPIWMDASTSRQCAEIAEVLGGDAEVVSITGSRAIERFTGPQIRKFFQQESAAWAETQEIHLVSSFMASLLIGGGAGIDLGDGAGMNLLSLADADWSPRMLDATAPGLRERLPEVVASRRQVGEIARYFVEKYGFSAGTPVIAFTGDNPSSLVGMGATRPGVAVVSLGTSDTVFAAMAAPRTDPRGCGHVFGNPAGGFMSLICFANGSLARERIATESGLDWDQFSAAILERTRPGNAKNLMLPYFVPEMTPKVIEPQPRRFGSPEFVSGKDSAAAARAVVEAQALSMRLHSDWIGEVPDTILVTGGASRNRGVLQVLADVFQAELRPLQVKNSSALGGALRAAQAVEGSDWAELSGHFCAPDADLVATPAPGTRAVYDALGGEFERRLGELLAAHR